MKIARKIQMAAAAATVNGIAALALLSPAPVLADSCPFDPYLQYICDFNLCWIGEEAQAACDSITPPGCSSLVFDCAWSGFCGHETLVLTCAIG